MIHRLEDLLSGASRFTPIADPIFRLLTSLIFIIGGLGHFGQHQMMLDRMEESSWAPTVGMIGDPSVLLSLSGVAFVAAGLTLAIGFMTRASALILFATLVPVTVAVHLVPDPSHVGPLFKNVAILGALLLIWARGPGAFALDNRPTACGDGK